MLCLLGDYERRARCASICVLLVLPQHLIEDHALGELIFIPTGAKKDSNQSAVGWHYKVLLCLHRLKINFVVQLIAHWDYQQFRFLSV